MVQSELPALNHYEGRRENSVSETWSAVLSKSLSENRPSNDEDSCGVKFLPRASVRNKRKSIATLETTARPRSAKTQINDFPVCVGLFPHVLPKRSPIVADFVL